MSSKYFLVKDLKKETEVMVRAATAGKAILAVAGEAAPITPALDPDELVEFLTNNDIHPKSRVDGPKRFFFVQNEDGSRSLIRAKNEGDAMTLIGTSDLQVTTLRVGDVAELTIKGTRLIKVDEDKGAEGETNSGEPSLGLFNSDDPSPEEPEPEPNSESGNSDVSDFL